MTATITDLAQVRSIQGERAQRDHNAYGAMDEGDVDSYVDSVTDEVLKCRQRGHDFPEARRNVALEFTEVRDGMLIRRARCRCCAKVERVEQWLPQIRGRGQIIRCERVSAHLNYFLDGSTPYLAPRGQGRLSPRQVESSVASKALQGTTLAAIKKRTKEAERHQETA